MNPSFNGGLASNGSHFSSQHHNLQQQPSFNFPNPTNVLKSGFNGSTNYNIGNILSSNLQSYPRCPTTMRKSRHFVPNECKDEYYWHKRLKNNEAARKSRQKRRTIDSVLEEKVLILLHENQQLRQELYALKVKYGLIPQTSENGDQCSSSSTTDSIIDSSGNLKKTGNSIALTNKLISQALAKSDEKRIGLRQSLLETINSQLSKENDTGKHKLLNHHQNLGLGSLQESESLHSFTSKIVNNNNNGNVNGSGSSQSNSSSNYTQELLQNLASGAYVLTSLKPGTEDMACLPAAIKGASSNLRLQSDQQMVVPLSIPICSKQIDSNGYQQHHRQVQKQQGEICTTDEKAMEAANTLANLLKRSGSTHSSCSMEHSISPTPPTTPNIQQQLNMTTAQIAAVVANHQQQQIHIVQQNKSPSQQQLAIQQQQQRINAIQQLQQQQQQQQKSTPMSIDDSSYVSYNEKNGSINGNHQKRSLSCHSEPLPQSPSSTSNSSIDNGKNGTNKSLPHKLRWKDGKTG